MEVNIESLFPEIRNSSISTFSDPLNTTYVGIDFGTSTTVVSIAHFDPSTSKITTAPIRCNQMFLDGGKASSEKVPTVIAWENNSILIGLGAAELKFKLRKGKNVWYSFKMELGEDHGVKYYDSELDGNQTFKILNPIDAATVFFQYLNAQIKRHLRDNDLPENVEYAVSIPASFEANQRRELISALETSGMRLKSQSLIDEPNAAFMSYIQNTTEEGNAIRIPEDHYPNLLVFDFGAGTCDISILELGRNLNGVYSKNLSISRFEKLGGDNIDDAIAREYLYPQILEQNNLSKEDLRSPEKKQIIQRLLKPAEELKIEICQNIALLMHERVLPENASSEEFISIGGEIKVDTTRHGVLTLRTPKISFAEFYEVMKKFLSVETKEFFNSDNEAVPSIFTPITTALEKARLEKSDIDHVLFIGGSSKNPYVQATLKNYFKDSELLIPRDLQTHVSEGAAIHSLLFNGFHKNIIQPITSEPLLVLTQDERPRVILKAGTQIPCDLIVIDDLVTAEESQESIELPICLGNENRILYNIVITSDDSAGFRKNTPVKLELEITTDKLLIARATAVGKEVMVEPMNPFANKELTTEQRVIFKAEKAANIERSKNNGKLSSGSLLRLAEAYSMAGNELRAAETLELHYELYSNLSNLNNIAVRYDNAGHNDKAKEFYEKAYKSSKNPTLIVNYSGQFMWSDRKRYKELLQEALEIDPNYARALVKMGEVRKIEGDDNWAESTRRAFDILYKKFKQNRLDEDEYYWLNSAAWSLGHKDIANEVNRSKPRKGANDELFNSENLTITDHSKKLNS